MSSACGKKKAFSRVTRSRSRKRTRSDDGGDDLDGEAAAVKRQRTGSESEKAGSETESGNESGEGSAASSSFVKEWKSKRFSLKEGMDHYATLKRYICPLLRVSFTPFAVTGTRILDYKLFFAKI